LTLPEKDLLFFSPYFTFSSFFYHQKPLAAGLHAKFQAYNNNTMWWQHTLGEKVSKGLWQVLSYKVSTFFFLSSFDGAGRINFRFSLNLFAPPPLSLFCIFLPNFFFFWGGIKLEKTRQSSCDGDIQGLRHLVSTRARQLFFLSLYTFLLFCLRLLSQKTSGGACEFLVDNPAVHLNN
jgi:hypothetical protein